MDYWMEEEEERIIRQRRKERAERMRREKQLQLQRRRQMKKILKIATGMLAVILLLTAGGIRLRKNVKAESVSEQEEPAAETMVQGQQESEPMEAEPESQEPVFVPLAENTGQVYQFTSTADTASVYQQEIISSHIILVDESTDTIVASRGAKEKISPASMTKVLTLLVAAEHISEEQLEETFTMTREITDYGYINDCSAVGFLEGEQIPIKDLFYGTILPSGSDAAVGLATYVAGSHEAFVEMMNQKLEELELSQSSHMTNCVGIYDENHYSTVYDIAVIMKAAVQNEFCKKILSEHHYVTTPTAEHPEGIDISNWFLRRIEDQDTGGEVLCAKTGYVMQSRNCAASYGVFADGKPYICVTAGSSSNWRCIYDHVDLYTKYTGAA